MTIATIKNTTLALEQSAQTLGVMYFLMKDGPGLKIKKVELEDVTQNELTSDITNELRIYFDDDYTLRDLTSLDHRDGAIYHYNLPEIPEQLEFLILAYNDQEDIANFDHSSDNISDLKAIIIVIGNGDEKLAIYKHHYPTNTFRKTGFSFWRAGMNQDRFEKLDQDIVRLSQSLDFVYDGQQLIVTNFKVLEKFFGFKDAVKQEATTQLNQLAARNIIENIVGLADRINIAGDMTFARKVIRALAHSPVLQTVSNETIIQFVKAHHTLGRKIKTNNLDTHFILDTQVSQNFFMKLLNDDYLKSELTQYEYDADSKDVVVAESE